MRHVFHAQPLKPYTQQEMPVRFRPKALHAFVV
jgi:hypothetical protein